jgi:hypothetical protein
MLTVETPAGQMTAAEERSTPMETVSGTDDTVPAATVRVLIRNLESDTSRLEFSSFSIEELNARRWDAAREFFPNAYRDEWLLRRDYMTIPPVEENWSGYGAIPFDIEDMLTLLRLYRPGDLAFVGVHMATPKNSSRQYPYRVISDLVSNYSTRPFRFTQGDCSAWEQFEAPLRTSTQWASPWFAVARRFFLYGGSKEFNPNFQNDVDRVIDYVTALEAVAVPESDFVSRRLRERSVRLLERQDDAERMAKKLLNDMYGVRSTLVHGSLLDERQMVLLRDKEQWWLFEDMVRNIMVSALRKVPADEVGRKAYLTGLYDLSDKERAEKVLQDFRSLKNDDVKQELLRALK